MHRDIKPANILFIENQPSLADYGLVGAPGASFDLRGTEGFRPMEGTNDFAADAFALGKSLYELWTGKDRLEFPSIPQSFIDSPEWNHQGRWLNEIILKACHADRRQRYESAAALAEALDQVLTGKQQINRRIWLVATGGVLAGLGATCIIARALSRPPAKAIWRRVRRKGFAVEAWAGHAGTVDWKRRRMYSINGDNGTCVFQYVDLERFELRAARTIPNGPKRNSSSIFHPETEEIWAIEGGRGDVFAFDPDRESIKSLGGGPSDNRHYNAATYWNPVTRRIGIFGGYGKLAVTNDRSEFDPVGHRWIEIDQDRRDTDLWPRDPWPMPSNSKGSQVFVVGGEGSPSGKQGDRVKGLNAPFSGHFYFLDDVWALGLQTNSWHQLLPPGHMNPERLRVFFYHPILEGLLLFEGMVATDIKTRAPEVFLFRPGIDTQPVKLRIEGEASELSQSRRSWALDPTNQELIVLAEDGIFRVTFEMTP